MSAQYFVLVINGNQINGFHLFWDTLYFVAQKLSLCGLPSGYDSAVD